MRVDEDRYGGDVLSGDWRSRGVQKVRQVPLERDMVLEDPDSGWAGAVVGLEAGNVALEDWKGRVRAFPFVGQFLLEGELVTLDRPQAPVGRSAAAAPPARSTATAGRPGAAPAVRHSSDGGRLRTASGSFAVEQQQRRQTARPGPADGRA